MKSKLCIFNKKFNINELVILFLATLTLLVSCNYSYAATTKKNVTSNAIIMYRTSSAGSWIGATRATIHKSFGKQDDDNEESEGEPIDSYGDVTNLKFDISFIYDTFSRDNNHVFCKAVVVEPRSATVNGISLDKNYEDLIRIMGQPTSKRFIPRQKDDFGDWDDAYHEVRFYLSAKNGKNLVAKFRFKDLKSSAYNIIIERR